MFGNAENSSGGGGHPRALISTRRVPPRRAAKSDNNSGQFAGCWWIPGDDSTCRAFDAPALLR